MAYFTHTTTWQSRPRGPFAPQPTTIPDPTSLGPLPPPPRMGPSDLREQRRRSQYRKEVIERRKDRRLWSNLQRFYLRAKPPKRPWDEWLPQREQVEAHNRALTDGYSHWNDYLFLSWEYHLDNAYERLGLPQWLRTYLQYHLGLPVWAGLGYLALRGIVWCFAVVLWWNCFIVINVAFWVAMLLHGAWYCFRGVWGSCAGTRMRGACWGASSAASWHAASSSGSCAVG
ncbi:hypothetical protein PG997_001970 [Apiospora hydei]|uniref:Uncharacterized protein n=1 Tax=Apiospora hydei TaxID=1337664 RepID=A0ABR1X865_9PEZI